MAAAFAERERDRYDLDIEILSGGTRPADDVHEEVGEAMREVGFDLAGRTPREIAAEELRSCDYVATMGCSTLDIDPGSDVDVREWDLPDPAGTDPETVRGIRDDVSRRVIALLAEIRGSGCERSEY